MYASFYDELEKIAAEEKPNWKRRLALGGAALGTVAAAGLAARKLRKGGNPYASSINSARKLRQQTEDIGRRISKAEKGVKDFKDFINKADATVGSLEGRLANKNVGKVINLADVRKARGLV